MFHGANQLVVTGGNFNINEPRSAIQGMHLLALDAILALCTMNWIVISQALEKNYLSSATHDTDDVLDAPKCHPGTRTFFLSHLSNWAKSAESSVYVTWLHGPAGAGKSAIARSLAEGLDGEGFLAGSFFFRKDSSRPNLEKSLVATLAYQLASSIRDILPHVAQAVETDPWICTRSLRSQFSKLIVYPFVQGSRSASFLSKLVIIDGLDECADQMAQSLILKSVFDNLPLLRGNLKFLIVSRPEHGIQRSFQSVPANLQQHVDTIELLGDLSAYEDVRIYLRDRFHRIKQTHTCRAHFTPDWPSDYEIERLVEKSSGHFIYASTVMKFVENDFDEPQKRLDDIINLRTSYHNPYAELDTLYFSILASSRTDRIQLVDILSIVILAHQLKIHDKLKLKWDPSTDVFLKSVCFLEMVLSLKKGGLQLTLLDLESPVRLAPSPKTSIPCVEFCHESFSDFLLDSSRSKEFYACYARASTLIAKGCLRLLSDETGLLKGWFTTTTSKVSHNVLSL